MSSTTWKTAKKRTRWREGDRLKAEQMRTTAMETMGKTQKRKSAEGQSKAKKCRISESKTVKFLKLKAAQDMDVKKQELELRKKEQEQIAEARNQQRDMFKQMKKQQKQMHDMQSLHLLLFITRKYTFIYTKSYINNVNTFFINSRKHFISVYRTFN